MSKLITIRVGTEIDEAYLMDMLDQAMIKCEDQTVEVVEVLDEDEDYDDEEA